MKMIRTSQPAQWLCFTVLLLGLTGCRHLGLTNPAQQAADNNELIRQLSLARLHERQGEHAAAEKIYLAVLSHDDGQAIAHHRLGVLAGRAGKLESAMRYFHKARKLGQDTPELLSDLAYAIYLSGDSVQAAQMLKKSLALNPGYKTAQNNLGIVLAAQEQDEASLAAFQQTGSLADALNNLAYMQSQRGDLAAARQTYLKALDFDPELKPAAEALVALKSHSATMDRMARREQTPATRVATAAFQSGNPRAVSAAAPSAAPAPRVEFLPPPPAAVSAPEAASTRPATTSASVPVQASAITPAAADGSTQTSAGNDSTDNSSAAQQWTTIPARSHALPISHTTEPVSRSTPAVTSAAAPATQRVVGQPVSADNCDPKTVTVPNEMTPIPDARFSATPELVPVPDALVPVPNGPLPAADERVFSPQPLDSSGQVPQPSPEEIVPVPETSLPAASPAQLSALFGGASGAATQPKTNSAHTYTDSDFVLPVSARSAAPVTQMVLSGEETVTPTDQAVFTQPHSPTARDLAPVRHVGLQSTVSPPSLRHVRTSALAAPAAARQMPAARHRARPTRPRPPRRNQWTFETTAAEDRPHFVETDKAIPATPVSAAPVPARGAATTTSSPNSNSFAESSRPLRPVPASQPAINSLIDE